MLLVYNITGTNNTSVEIQTQTIPYIDRGRCEHEAGCRPQDTARRPGEGALSSGHEWDEADLEA